MRIYSSSNYPVRSRFTTYMAGSPRPIMRWFNRNLMTLLVWNWIFLTLSRLRRSNCENTRLVIIVSLSRSFLLRSGMYFRSEMLQPKRLSDVNFVYFAISLLVYCIAFWYAVYKQRWCCAMLSVYWVAWRTDAQFEGNENYYVDESCRLVKISLAIQGLHLRPTNHPTLTPM